MSDKLQPCPFCGDVNPSMQGQTDRTLSYEPSAWIECETCGAQSRGFCRTSEAMEAWNRRTPSAPSAAIVQGEPVAWVYTLVVEGQTVSEQITHVNWNPEYQPFGRNGIDHGGEVSKTPLYAAPPLTAASGMDKLTENGGK